MSKNHKRGYTPFVMKRGVDLIVKERDKQKNKHGYKVLNDIENTTTMDLMLAAETYLCAAEGFGFHALNTVWPWDKKYFHNEGTKTCLIKAGALIAAALDRMNAEYFAGEPKLFFDKIGKRWAVSGYSLQPGDEWVTEMFQTSTAPTLFAALKAAKKGLEHEFKYCRAA